MQELRLCRHIACEITMKTQDRKMFKRHFSPLRMVSYFTQYQGIVVNGSAHVLLHVRRVQAEHFW